MPVLGGSRPWAAGIYRKSVKLNCMYCYLPIEDNEYCIDTMDLNRQIICKTGCDLKFSVLWGIRGKNWPKSLKLFQN